MKTYNLDNILDLTGKDEKLQNMVKVQKEGIELALNILENRNYVLIADDVGMGKTFEGLGIAFYKISKSKGSNILIVAPSNEVAEKWNDELEEFKKCWKDKKEIKNDNDNYYLSKIYDEKELKLKTKSEINPEKNYITIINLKKFSYIKFDDNDTDESIISQLKKDSMKLPNYDLVIIDESQNLRRHESKKSKFFSAMFGLENNGNSKFKKIVLLTATPNHSCKNDILSQVLYFDPNMTEDKINTQIIANKKNFDRNLKEGRFIIKRHRKYDGKNKYEFREFKNHNTDDMNFFEMLTMALIEKRQIAEKNGVFKMGYLDGFESFISSEKIENKNIPILDEDNRNVKISDYYLKENGNLIEKSEKYYIDDLYKDIKDFSEQHSIDLNKLLTHPKPRYIRQLLKRTDNLDKIQKSLIFVRRVSSIEEIEKQLISNFDDEIQKLVFEINNNIKSLSYLERKIRSILKNEYKNENEYEYEDEETIDAQTNEDEHNENIKSMWLEKLESKKVGGKETSIFNKMKIKFQSGLDNKYYKFFEPKILNSFFSQEKIDEIYKKNEKKINSYILRYNAILKEKKLRGYHKIRAFTAGFLTFMSETNENYKKICYEYEKAMNLKKLDENKTLKIDLNGIKDFYIEFLNQKNFWDINEFENSIINSKNELIDLNLFIRQLNMKKIIEKNLLNSEGMIYILAIISKLNKKYKLKEITLDELIKFINNDKSVFYKRIMTRITEFINNYNKVEKQLKKLNIDKSYFKSPVAGASGNTPKGKRITIQKLFNTSFYPDILISTDIFNEGIDLHIFCSRIINYGIAWLPGEMEQRIGRIDRFFCKAYRDYEDSKKENKNGIVKQINVDFIHMDDEMDKRQISKILGRMIEAIKDLEHYKDGEKSKEVDCKEEKNDISEKIYILNNIGEKI